MGVFELPRACNKMLLLGQSGLGTAQPGGRRNRKAKVIPGSFPSRLMLGSGAALLLLSGCGAKDKKPDKTAMVGYVVAAVTSAPMTVELPGRTAALQQSDVRPQVSGVIRRRLFTEGSLVHQGQTLYEIDASLYRAAASEAQANLQSAVASAEAKQVQARRLKPLAEMEAVAKQDYTDAVAAARQAQASIAQNRALLQTAQINLRYTTVPAPITGRIGRSLATVGALVTSNQTDPLAQISQLDPMFVDIQQSSADMLALRRSLAKGGMTPASADVRLILEDGSAYASVGRVEFSESIVDPATGSVTLRARFPNPQNILLPGMFVRARLVQAIDRNIFLVPQIAVSRDPQGNATLYVVDAHNHAVQRSVAALRTQGMYWVVTKGLKPGDKIITQGTASLKPDQTVKAVPADSKQIVAPSDPNKPAKGS